MNRQQLKDCFNKLKALGYVDYDKTVPVRVLEDVLGIRYRDDWTWRGPLLELRGYLTDLGYFLSERGTEEGDIRFLSVQEIPNHLYKRRLKRYEKMNTDLKAAKRLPTVDLGDRNYKILLHEQDRLSRDLQKLSESDAELRELICNS